jgi:hypothetical protein
MGFGDNDTVLTAPKPTHIQLNEGCWALRQPFSDEVLARQG